MTHDEKQDIKIARTQLFVGIAILLAVLITSTFSVVGSYQTKKRDEELRECNRRTIETLHKRSLFAKDDADLQERSDDNLLSIADGIASQASPEQWQQILNAFVTESQQISDERDRIRKERAKLIYPSLDSCQ